MAAGEKITEIMHAFLKGIRREHFTFAEFIKGLEERSFGLLLLILAIPNACLIASIPGVSILFGVLLIFVSMQMLLKRQKAWFPKAIANQRLSKKHLEIALNIFSPYLAKIERILKPRLTLLTSAFLERFLGVVCLMHGILIALPIPLGNFLCGIALVFLALGVLARDGLFMLFGYVISVGIFTFFAASFNVAFLLVQKIVYNLCALLLQ
ncbi:MAG: exopolysaccharide biosynthesis protein [Pseudomonadota bacterium]|jgi:hypothetical protein|nr:exopolysaccharide biosynthesis protein [Alphaproteobacteria bacterium]